MLTLLPLTHNLQHLASIKNTITMTKLSVLAKNKSDKNNLITFDKT